MGLETVCTARLNNMASEGKAHCGDGELQFRGEFKFKWKWTDLVSVAAVDGVLVVVRGADKAELELGDQATKWEQAIKNPKSRLDKLGLKPGHAYDAWGEFDDLFAPECAARAGDPSTDGHLDIIFVRLKTKDDLVEIARARSQIKPNGAVWAVWAKGRKELTENDVRAYALDHRLVDVKVASFSAELSSLKLVIPVGLR